MKKIGFFFIYTFLTINLMKYIDVPELFSPILLFLLKKDEYSLFWIYGLFVVVLEEGASFLHFGIFFPFLFVQFFIFWALKVYISSDNIIFDFIYFFILSCSLHFIVYILSYLQNIYVQGFNVFLYFTLNIFLYFILEFCCFNYEFTKTKN